jgi:membrane protein
MDPAVDSALADRGALRPREGSLMAAGPFDLGGLTLRQLARRVWTGMSEDTMWDTASSLAYYFLLALFPLVISLISLLSVMQATNLVTRFMESLGEVMPAGAFSLLGGQVERTLSRPRTGLLTLGALGTLWAASSGVSSLMGGLNRAYDVTEDRGFLGRRAVAIGLTVALAFLTILGAVLLMAGDRISWWIAGLVGVAWLSIVGTFVNYVVGLGMMFLGLSVIYTFGPNLKDRTWKWASPGALVAVVLFVLSSTALSLYMRMSTSYNDVTYGSLSAVIVLMLWLFNLGLAIAAGAEVDSEIAAAKAYGRAVAPGPTAEPEPSSPRQDGDRSPKTAVTG